MSTDEEIDLLMSALAETHGERLDALIADKICEATCAQQWDEVIKWNRVRWRSRLRSRHAGLTQNSRVTGSLTSAVVAP